MISAEFPLSLISATFTGSTYRLTFSVANKTASPLLLSAFFITDNAKSSTDRVAEKEENVFDVSVSPLTASTVQVSLEQIHPDVLPAKLLIEFELKFSETGNMYVRFYPSRNSKASGPLLAALGVETKTN
jgi:hypothetical protein